MNKYIKDENKKTLKNEYTNEFERTIGTKYHFAKLLTIWTPYLEKWTPYLEKRLCASADINFELCFVVCSRED